MCVLCADSGAASIGPRRFRLLNALRSSRRGPKVAVRQTHAVAQILVIAVRRVGLMLPALRGLDAAIAAREFFECRDGVALGFAVARDLLLHHHFEARQIGARLLDGLGAIPARLDAVGVLM